MADDPTIRGCARRARWYVDRIDDLLGLMKAKPQLDGDDVEQCQAMLRELLARFRADRRPPTEGHVQTRPEVDFTWSVAAAAEVVKVAASTRPTARWRTDLAAAKRRMEDYLDRSASSRAHPRAEPTFSTRAAVPASKSASATATLQVGPRAAEYAD